MLKHKFCLFIIFLEYQIILLEFLIDKYSFYIEADTIN